MPFTIRTSLNVFGPEEIELLHHHGRGFERLMNGELQVTQIHLATNRIGAMRPAESRPTSVSFCQDPSATD
jgi:hypothetical protein